MADAVDVTPTRVEARRLVGSIVVFWLIAALAPKEAGGAGGFVLAIVALAAGFTFYRTLYAVGGRSTGRTVKEHFGWTVPRLRGPDSMFVVGREGWAILLKGLDPRWWAIVIRTTGWPAPFTAMVLIASLIGALANAFLQLTAA